MPAPLTLGFMALGLELFGVLVVGFAPRAPLADLPHNRIDRQPQRLADHKHLDFAQWLVRDIARRLRLDRAFDVGWPFGRKLTC